MFTAPDPKKYAPTKKYPQSSDLVKTYDAGNLSYYRTHTSGVAFAVPLGTDTAEVLRRGAYSDARSLFVADTGYAKMTDEDAAEADAWWGANVNPLWY
jgi:hypothetical protein